MKKRFDWCLILIDIIEKLLNEADLSILIIVIC
ncbi:Schizosaccharomyces pombe specific protein [Schizosaccharomyces pombe]|uniref:Uncharacterized protein C1711.15c n=1 Tax=Schizosaccharomyces pombe (strain 972 / ATCC 24843) TaxID=284812 RepID=YNYF_SCHPO|nr:uncharacterized protein SPBC1711.15c [Schizosaccharomyces pombe]Q9P776.1 RecName: Full=Uncharacterized protein C1711.15c [Schizosaccharomyces pombe 972h-]CAB88245.1 sequence orphan [Schizosaccharomyces pombe]|eukprot:NP_001342956.1 uncharacterized protein SPBC1711.15c [Schizosaccharomyces pombe]